MREPVSVDGKVACMLREQLGLDEDEPSIMILNDSKVHMLLRWTDKFTVYELTEENCIGSYEWKDREKGILEMKVDYGPSAQTN